MSTTTSPLSAHRSRAIDLRSKGRAFEADRADAVADRVERHQARPPATAPVTVELLTHLRFEALDAVEFESAYRGSSYDEAVARLAAIDAALVELGA